MKTDIVQWSLKRVATVEGFMKICPPWTHRLPVPESCSNSQRGRAGKAQREKCSSQEARECDHIRWGETKITLVRTGCHCYNKKKFNIIHTQLIMKHRDILNEYKYAKITDYILRWWAKYQWQEELIMISTNVTISVYWRENERNIRCMKKTDKDKVQKHQYIHNTGFKDSVETWRCVL